MVAKINWAKLKTSKQRFFSGQVISIVGPTGSGKSRLLADIECLAQQDTPTKRQILIDDEILDDEARFNLEGKLVAQLSQNMNFIMDITVEDFLTMHAKVRLGKEIENEKVIIAKCFSMANELAGEKIYFRYESNSIIRWSIKGFDDSRCGMYQQFTDCID